jgi:hypothetical protein
MVLIFKWKDMAFPHKFRSLYRCSYSAHNRFGDVGCKLLSTWKSATLAYLDLCTLRITRKQLDQWQRMLVFKPIQVAFDKISLFKYTLLHIENNCFGDYGCEHLSKSDWQKLQLITISPFSSIKITKW